VPVLNMLEISFTALLCVLFKKPLSLRPNPEGLGLKVAFVWIF
jgi:hypothetical protein